MKDLKQVKSTENDNVVTEATGNEPANPDVESKELLEEAKKIAKTTGRVPRENAIVCTAPGELVDAQFIQQKIDPVTMKVALGLVKAIRKTVGYQPSGREVILNMDNETCIESIEEHQIYKIDKSLIGRSTLDDRSKFDFMVDFQVTVWRP